jgi:hypothetical protein
MYTKIAPRISNQKVHLRVAGSVIVVTGSLFALVVVVVTADRMAAWAASTSAGTKAATAKM